MIITGWKDIAQYLGVGVRTVQRWERSGLPVKRPGPGRKAHVVADSEELASWVRDNPFWRRHDTDILETVRRGRKLRAEAQQAREILQARMDILRKEMAALLAKKRSS